MTATEVRLNREGRPWGVPRVGLALRYSHEVATGQSWGRGQVEAYECGYCSAWHVGVTPLWKRRRIKRAGSDWALWHELGDRAWWNLVTENRGQEAKRHRAVAARVYAARTRNSPPDP